ncbi:tetratricopeptide repeat protein [Aphanothece sacrum]|uniref:TPR repeat-containing protein n=1 Tax=Aphanothece sacrum FPU1 TaxID=1920663 RepID=A0A401IL59_APHSA|nr:hypothetical protein [Aphanothece sacrum]GBF81982.1 TPR repeat-containing protein [Aphanothece sacrum FPU1]GBF83612.1 TPR repeat-containing protein [Aphanothece sacrum FPU3]
MIHFHLINSKFWGLILTAITLTQVSFLVNTGPVFAQLPDPKINPLELPLDDILIPAFPRPLTPFEQRKLRQALDELNAQAQAESDKGNDEVAFEIWYRELRLRRVLGRLEEIKALGRVGEIAWNKTRTIDVQFISKRLVTLQNLSEQEDPLSPELLLALAEAYQRLHSLDNSINIYQKVLRNARKNEAPLTEEEALKGLGKLYLAKFDYPNSATIYEELLDRAQAKPNAYEEGIYLQQLAEIYNKSLQPENAANIKQRLVENYLKSKKILFIPPLKISIGQDYEAMDQPEQASQNYQEAYSLAWSLQLFGAAGEALTKLGNLYQNYEQDDYALQIYQNLLQVEQLSYNYYGLMKVYDQVGQIYFKREQYPQALASFQQGLVLAKAINYKQDYFISKIQEVNQKMTASEQ